MAPSVRRRTTGAPVRLHRPRGVASTPSAPAISDCSQELVPFRFAGLLTALGSRHGLSFAPNHIGMPLVSPKLKLDFLRRQVLMSRNISGGPPISVFMGGLNYQIDHHLFPSSMARPQLRKAQPLVVAYCAAQGVPYTRTTLCQSYRIVIG